MSGNVTRIMQVNLSLCGDTEIRGPKSVDLFVFIIFPFFFRVYNARLEAIRHAAVRETGVSEHHGGQIRNSLKPIEYHVI